MDELDRAIINTLQDGLPVCEHPYAGAAEGLGVSEDDLIERLKRLLADGVLSRFGPMYDAERMGGAFSLCAMRVDAADFDRVSGMVNAFPEVAHNYERDHAFNMWFVLATESPQRVDEVIEEIRSRTGYAVFNMPKLDEYYVGLRLSA
jgi:DNA-binding Lrp family transcriptional regulator